MRHQKFPKKEVKQFNVRITPNHIELVDKMAYSLNKTQGEIVEAALKMYAKSKKMDIPEGQAS